ncbi:lysozyme inhibitor LprI family protein [Lysobacter sp. Root494]|uniref:lysozyme inhibitor LprI family protein n=1 Tax=Lysobacter sp. Root494 TaxID=1736549 RepID=UPI0006FB9A12|nr:lysozyme inhibitor LprI family protein [Lysobacter sp. Root494]KQY51084.1 hypothetical protein ASD14_09695 [Lysobacter sp. Root494]
MKLTYLLPLLLLTCNSVVAAPDCGSKNTQSEMNACAAQEFRAADAELNEIYHAILKQHASDALFLKKLKASQRLWIQLRDADLEARFPLAPGQSAQVEYGSIYPLEYAIAKTELTRERTRYLRAHWLPDNSR